MENYESANLILRFAKKLHEMNQFLLEDLLELYSIKPQKDCNDYLIQVLNGYGKGNINFLQTKIIKAEPIINAEKDLNRKNKMLEKYESWKDEVSRWKKLTS